MPISRNADLARRVARSLDTEAAAFDTISPELVGVVLVEDISKPMQRSGLALSAIAAALGFRSEIAIVVVNGRMSSDEILFISEVGLSAPVLIGIEFFIEIPTAGFTAVNVSYGDALYGDIAPFVIQTKNTALLSPGGRNLGGASFTIPANRPTVFPVNVTLRPGDVFPTASNVLLVRPTVDNAQIDAWFRWEVRKDVR